MINVIEVFKYRNCGTSVWVSIEDNEIVKSSNDLNDVLRRSGFYIEGYSYSYAKFYKCKRYYLDNRIGSNTKGELFDRYPEYGGAELLDKSNFNFITQEQLDRDNKIDQICN